jgi:hypothetical protein
LIRASAPPLLAERRFRVVLEHPAVDRRSLLMYATGSRRARGVCSRQMLERRSTLGSISFGATPT